MLSNNSVIAGGLEVLEGAGERVSL